jgi:hypothetical protein|nr:MAG: hypothetical protein KatS3mg041_1039 [Bacteroidota bacterium]
MGVFLRWLPAAMLLLSGSGAWAQPYAVLRMETSARLSALGGASTALPMGDLGAAWYNPALLPEGQAPEFGLGYGRVLGTVETFWLGLRRSLSTRGALGGHILLVHYGSFERLSESGEEEGRFAAGEVVFALQYRYTWPGGIRSGIALRTLYSLLDQYRALVLVLDAGLVWPLGQGWTAALVARHLGRAVQTYTATNEQPAPEVIVSVSKRLAYLPFTAHLAFSTPSEMPERFSVLGRQLALGGEFALSPAFLLRVGYRVREQAELRQRNRLDAAGLRFGFGLQVRRFGLDYTYRSFSTPGGAHLWSLRLLL